MTHDFAINIDILGPYLENKIAGFSGLQIAKKFNDGQSNPTYLLIAKSGKYVLRRKPPGATLKGAHAVDREFKVLSALGETDVPVAQVYHLCQDEAIIGTIFYVMEYVDALIYWDPALPNKLPEERSKIYGEMVNILAALHQVDINTTGLSNFGKPGNYFARQIHRWSGAYCESETETIVEMDQLIGWLSENVPDDDGRISLIHGDFRIDNMMFSDDDKLVALMDWELSTLGHPFADLAYQCMQLRMPTGGIMPGLGGLDRSALSIPEEEQYVEKYCDLMGISRIENWGFYIAFSAFRFAAILQGVKKRALQGNASSNKAHDMGELVQPLATMGLGALSIS